MKAELLQSTSFVVFAIVCVVAVTVMFFGAREHLKVQREVRRMRRKMDKQILEIVLRARRDATTS